MAEPSRVYRRFKMEAQTAPPRHKQPHPFYPLVNKFGLAKFLLVEALHYHFKLLYDGRYRQLLTSRPCIYGVFDGPLGGFSPIREKCTGCMRCVFQFPEFCRVERNPAFTQFADSYWISRDLQAGVAATPVSTVEYESETGKIPIKGMGYKGSFAATAWDAIWTDMSEIVRPTRDGVYGREYISMVVDLGRKPALVSFENGQPLYTSRTVQSTLPILFDYLPPALNNSDIQQSVAMASKATGTFYLAADNFSSLPEETKGCCIPLVCPENLETVKPWLARALAIEFLEQDWGSLYEPLRALCPRTPLICRLPLRRGVETRAVELVRLGLDALHLTANYHGESADARPIFIRDMIRLVHTRLVAERIRDQVTLIGSGGIILAEHAPKAIICGVDLVAIDTTILVALQCKFAGECASAETGKLLPDSFDPAWGASRLMNLLKSWHDQGIEILSAMGMRDVRRLRGEVGRAMFKEDLEKEAFGDIALSP